MRTVGQATACSSACLRQKDARLIQQRYGCRQTVRMRCSGRHRLRFLLRRTAAGETTRVLAISPRNTVLLEQLRGYQQDPETGKPLKGDDDAVDSLIALVAPIARRHRDLTDIETA